MFKLKLNIKRIILQYLTFFISLGLTLFLEKLILNELNFIILQNLNLLLFTNLQILSLLFFLIIFTVLNLLFKIFTKKDIKNLESFFDKDKKLHYLIKKCLNIFKRFLKE